MKTQSSFIKQREKQDNVHTQLTNLTKADINLLKLVEAAQKDIGLKNQILEKIKLHSANEPKGVQKFIDNFKVHSLTDNFKHERKIIAFRNTLQSTKQILQLEDSEEMQRIKRIIENTEEIKRTYEKVQTIVIQQGNIIDRIDYNLKRGQLYINKGNKELEMLFDSYNKTAFGCQLFLLLILTIESLIIFYKIIR